jgi:glucokinase
LGLALGNVCALMTVNTVVLGGGADGAIDLLLPHVRRELAARASLVPGIEVRRAALGPAAGAIGAALWARESTTGTSDQRERNHVALDH